jgi:hypothetical protein
MADDAWPLVELWIDGFDPQLPKNRCDIFGVADVDIYPQHLVIGWISRAVAEIDGSIGLPTVEPKGETVFRRL